MQDTNSLSNRSEGKIVSASRTHSLPSITFGRRRVPTVSGISPASASARRPVNLGNIVTQTSVIAITPMGRQLAILPRGISLSVDSNLALCRVTGGLAFNATGARCRSALPFW
jgi:ribose/xylose/arabinose/galactoside ABC-type transport system permease subunit